MVGYNNIKKHLLKMGVASSVGAKVHNKMTCVCTRLRNYWLS